MRPRLLTEIVNVGYEIFLEGNHLRLSYRKPGNPPETVKPLIDELRACKDEALALLKANHVSPEPFEAWRNTEAFDPVTWFLNAELPQEPFSLSLWEFICNPKKYYDFLKLDIAFGPEGPRARTGALQNDLKRLKIFTNTYQKMTGGHDYGNKPK